MNPVLKFRALALGLTLALLPATALATDGYFQHGYGLKAQAMGGVAVALADDTFGGANNPASMVWVGNRVDAGLVLFIPHRSARRVGNAFGLNGGSESGHNDFVMPQFGYNHVLAPGVSLGVTVYGNGGMDTDYPGDTIAAGHCGAQAPASNLLCGQGRLGVDLEQLVVAPTVSFKVGQRNSFGVSVLLAYQRFKAYGLQAFARASAAPAQLTNRGASASTGVGIRVGWLSHLTDRISVGVSYSPKTHMSRFKQYAGLFAGHGRFDLPENYALGVAFTPARGVTLAFDYQRINYGNVDAVGRASTVRAPLGSSGGPGFGWRNINVYKLGASYRIDRRWTLRAGFNHADNPVRSRDITFNILAPGVVQNHLTLGATFHTAAGGELTVAYMHAFENTTRGQAAALIPGGGTETLAMHEDSFGVEYGWTF